LKQKRRRAQTKSDNFPLNPLPQPLPFEFPVSQSQRDWSIQPKVGPIPEGLPWVCASKFNNPERVEYQTLTNPIQPFQGCASFVFLPKVARSSQPRAERSQSLQDCSRRPLSGDDFHARSETKLAKKFLTILPGQAERTNIRHAKPGNDVGKSPGVALGKLVVD
jgi:hypothetical protein